MKVIPTNYSKIGLHVWMLGRNLLSYKRNLRRMMKSRAPEGAVGYMRGVTGEAHNVFQGAKQSFAEDLVKVNSPEMKT